MVENLNADSSRNNDSPKKRIFSKTPLQQTIEPKPKKNTKGILVFCNTGQKETSTHDVHLTNSDTEQ